MVSSFLFFFFFFQAEDGIRDHCVTGVQTCALPISSPVLTVLGRPEMLPRLLLAPIVAVVGARNASANGRRLARELAAELGQNGIVVASGLARGIDAAAHLGALETGSVAVVAGGRRHGLP